MSTLLVSVLLAYSRHAKQLQRNAQRRQAVVAADQLLERWHRHLTSVPRAGSGQFADSDLLWQTQQVVQKEAELLAVEVIRLTVRRYDAAVDQPPLLSVDFVVPVPIAPTPADPTSTDNAQPSASPST